MPDVPGVFTCCTCPWGSRIVVLVLLYRVFATQGCAFSPAPAVSSRSPHDTGVWSVWLVQMLTASGSLGDGGSPVSLVSTSGSVNPLATTSTDSSAGHGLLSGLKGVKPQVP